MPVSTNIIQIYIAIKGLGWSHLRYHDQAHYFSKKLIKETHASCINTRTLCGVWQLMETNKLRLVC